VWALAAVRRLADFRHFATILLLVGTIVGGIAGATEGSLFRADGSAGWQPTFKLFFLVIGSLFLVLGTLIQGVASKDASTLLRDGKRAVDAARAYARDGDALRLALADSEADIVQRIALNNAYNSMREAVERCLSTAEMTEEQAVSLMLRSAAQYLRIAIGVVTQEETELAISKAVVIDGSSALQRIAVSRPMRPEDAANSRIWPIGVGFIGVALRDNRDVILDDTDADEVRENYPVPESLQNYDDRLHYRSITAIPVRLKSSDEPWGVVFGSSSEVGRFARATATRQASVAAVQAVAGMMAVLAEGLRCRG
jgi:GAF domain-containing protein